LGPTNPERRLAKDVPCSRRPLEVAVAIFVAVETLLFIGQLVIQRR
jgi:hypothetical protein